MSGLLQARTAMAANHPRHDPRQPTRRGFLELLAALPAAAWAGAAGRAAPAKIPFGVQLYSVRHQLARDLPGTFSALAEIGFEAVEFADYFGRPAAELRRLLDENGLRCCGTHIYLEDMLGDSLGPTVEFNRTLGNRNLIVRWLGEQRRASLEAFEATIRDFNVAAANLAPHGMRVGYHNHDYIFETLAGRTLWERLAEGTGDEVILQLDTGNAARAGQDVVSLLERTPGRIGSIHAKPFSSSSPRAFIGRDELDWPRILELCRDSAGTQWLIVEYEEEGVDPLEALAANLAALKDLL